MSDDSSRGVTPADVAAARQEVVDAMARCAEVCGAKRSYGELYGILYFADEPLSLDTLAAESGYAKSTISTAMNTLERFHLVQRRSLPGEGKRAFFEAEEAFWDIFQQFLDQQVRRELDQLSRALEAAGMVLEEADDDRAQTDLAKIRHLRAASDDAEALVNALTSDDVDHVGTLVQRLEE